MENKLKNKQSESGSSGLLRPKETVREEGFSVVELLVVLAIAVVLSTLAIPTMITQRRLLRSVGLNREINTQLRQARQLAMSERQAITFQYDDTAKVIKIIDHNNDPTSATSGTAVLADPLYPNVTAPAVVVSTVDLTQGGLSGSEISYGIPTSSDLPNGHPTIPTGALADGIVMTTLPSSKKINITFQADGSVVNPSGVPVGGIPLSQGTRMDSAIFLFNNKAASATASAISVLGVSGRVRVWRYTSANVYSE
jgi:prepilin-type N-terminal cleavage/methylation domain-containing protein